MADPCICFFPFLEVGVHDIPQLYVMEIVLCLREYGLKFCLLLLKFGYFLFVILSNFVDLGCIVIVNSSFLNHACFYFIVHDTVLIIDLLIAVSGLTEGFLQFEELVVVGRRRIKFELGVDVSDVGFMAQLQQT